MNVHSKHPWLAILGVFIGLFCFSQIQIAHAQITSLANGGTGSSLSDPNADAIMYWNDATNQMSFLNIGSGLTLSSNGINGSTLSATGVGDVIDVGDCSSGSCFNGNGGTSLQFEGATNDNNEVTLTTADPTSDVTVTIPAENGTVVVSNEIQVVRAQSFNPLGNGSKLVQAIATAQSKNPSFQNPILIHVEAGYYVINSPLTLPPFVSLVGSGENSTIVEFSSDIAFVTNHKSSIRELTIRNNVSNVNPVVVAIHNLAGSTAEIKDVTLDLNNNANSSQTVGGIWNEGEIQVIDSTVQVINNSTTSGLAINVYSSGITTIQRSQIKNLNGGLGAIFIDQGTQFNVSSSMIDGNLNTISASVKKVYCYNGAFNAI